MIDSSSRSSRRSFPLNSSIIFYIFVPSGKFLFEPFLAPQNYLPRERKVKGCDPQFGNGGGGIADEGSSHSLDWQPLYSEVSMLSGMC